MAEKILSTFWGVIMKKLSDLNLFVLTLGMLGAISSYGTINIVKEHSGEQTRFGDGPCELSGTCGLKKVFHKAMHKEIIVQGDKYYSTDFYFGYETGSVDQIENFAVVQLIKGCQWQESKHILTGEIKKSFSIVREYYGGTKTFVHKDYEIDNTDANPFYSSFVRPDSPEDKFSLLRWNRPEDGVNVDKSTYYFQGTPIAPKVYVTDLPGPAYFISDNQNGNMVAQNSILEFRTCLMPITAVDYNSPSDGSGVQWNRAISCVTWNSSKVYDWEQEKMIEPVLPDTTCSDYSVELGDELL